MGEMKSVQAGVLKDEVEKVRIFAARADSGR